MVHSGATGKPLCLLSVGCDGGGQVDNRCRHLLSVAFRDTGHNVDFNKSAVVNICVF